MRSIFVSHWSIISSTCMTFIHQIVFKIWDKIKSLTHICSMRPTFVSHWSIIPNIIFLHQTVFTILSKITGPWNIGHIEVNLCVKLIHYPKYDLHPSNSFQDIRQNHWTMKCRSPTYIYFMWSIFVSHWSIISSMIFIHQIVLKI